MNEDATQSMHRLTKFSALAVTAVAALLALVVTLAWLGSGEEIVEPSAPITLFNEELVQQIYSRVSPAVVVIRADLKSDDTFTPITSGSGFLIDRAGHIATNNHVIQGADRVLVEFPNGTVTLAEVLGTSPGNDLAILQIDAGLVANTQPVSLGDSSKAQPGQMAVAIGSPFGLGGSITVGVVGGINRVLGSDVARPVHGILQTDAVTNPGDSGGPLLDRSGTVVGINTAVQAGPLGFEAESSGRRIGFALPINTLVRLLPMLVEQQVIQPNLFGIAGITIDDMLAKQLDLPVRSGVYVTRVILDSPAQQARLVPAGAGSRRSSAGGDTIVAVDGVPVVSTTEFFAELDNHYPGDEVMLSAVRKRVQFEVAVTLAPWPKDGNPFVNSANVGQQASDDPVPPYPFVPLVPGFSFPSLLPERSSK